MPSPFYGIPDVPYARCQQIVNNAIAAWHTLVVTVAAENIAMGITQQQKTKYIADIMMPVMMYGQTGSLWEAYTALNQIQVTDDMAPFITKARIEWMKNELIQIIGTL